MAAHWLAQRPGDEYAYDVRLAVSRTAARPGPRQSFPHDRRNTDGTWLRVAGGPRRRCRGHLARRTQHRGGERRIAHDSQAGAMTLRRPTIGADDVAWLAETSSSTPGSATVARPTRHRTAGRPRCRVSRPRRGEETATSRSCVKREGWSARDACTKTAGDHGLPGQRSGNRRARRERGRRVVHGAGPAADTARILRRSGGALPGARSRERTGRRAGRPGAARRSARGRQLARRQRAAGGDPRPALDTGGAAGSPLTVAAGNAIALAGFPRMAPPATPCSLPGRRSPPRRRCARRWSGCAEAQAARALC